MRTLYVDCQPRHNALLRCVHTVNLTIPRRFQYLQQGTLWPRVNDTRGRVMMMKRFSSGIERFIDPDFSRFVMSRMLTCAVRVRALWSTVGSILAAGRSSSGSVSGTPSEGRFELRAPSESSYDRKPPTIIIMSVATWTLLNHVKSVFFLFLVAISTGTIFSCCPGKQSFSAPNVGYSGARRGYPLLLLCLRSNNVWA